MRLLATVTFCASLWMAAASSVYAVGGFAHTVTMSPDSRDTITVTSFLDNIPTIGFMPLRVVIDNRSSSDRTWRMSPQFSMGDWISSTWQFSVRSGSRAEFEIMIQLKVSNLGYRWGAQFQWSGPGVEIGQMQLPQTGSASYSSPPSFIALSDSLHAKHWGNMQSKNSDLIGASLDLTQTSADWRAYSGLDQIWMTQAEWAVLSGEKRQAMMERLALGGDLVLVCDDAQQQEEAQRYFGETGADNREWTRGGARIRTLVIDAAKPSLNRLMEAQRDAPSRTALIDGHQSSNYLRDGVEDVSVAGPLVLIFILVFGILAGPVNLFVLAPATRRHRLFITTPVISLVGAAILSALIFIQDGLGGSGSRLIHAQILPDVKRLLITQEQASRTGLLVGTRFSTPDPAWVQPIFSQNPFGVSTDAGRYVQESDGSRSRDWFRSRSRQVQVLQATRPSRAALEFTPASEPDLPPSVVSSMESDLKQLFVVDSAGKVWHAQNVRPGERRALKPTTTRALSDWSRDFTSRHDPGDLVKSTFNRARSGKGIFVAEPADEAPFAVPTLNSIRWHSGAVLLTGPLVLSGI